MADGDRLAAHVLEQLASLGPLQMRRMFSGAGLFLDGRMFGLIFGETLYLKANDANRPDFEAEGLGPFTYSRSGGRTIAMSYWQAPERLLDDEGEMQTWARKAVAAAQSVDAKAAKASKKANPRKARRKNSPASNQRHKRN